MKKCRFPDSLMSKQEAYPFTVKPKGEMKDKWDMLVLGDAVPVAAEPLEKIYPTKTQNPCEMKA